VEEDDMNKTLSRIIIEATVIAGALSIFIGIVQKLTHLSSIYTPHFLGLSASDFINFGQVCFLFAIALAARRILKHMEYAMKTDRAAWRDRSSPVIT